MRRPPIAPRASRSAGRSGSRFSKYSTPGVSAYPWRRKASCPTPPSGSRAAMRRTPILSRRSSRAWSSADPMPWWRAPGWMAMRSTQARSPVTRATQVPTTRPSLIATTAGSPPPRASITSATTNSGARPVSDEAFQTPTASSRSEASKSRMCGTAMVDLVMGRTCRLALWDRSGLRSRRTRPPTRRAPEQGVGHPCAWPSQARSSKSSTPRTVSRRWTWPGSCGTSTSASWTTTRAAAPVPGDWVLIHVGFALSKVDEEEALATRKLLEGMGADYEQELEELRTSLIE